MVILRINLIRYFVFVLDTNLPTMLRLTLKPPQPGTFFLPQINQGIQERTYQQKVVETKIANEQIVSNEQFEQLKKIKFKDESLLINPALLGPHEQLKATKKGRLLLSKSLGQAFEVMALVKELGFDKTYEFLTSKEFKDYADLLFNFPTISNQKEKVKTEIALITSKLNAVESEFECRKCHSFNTLAIEKQTRSADEASTVKVKCLDCSHVYRL